MPKQTRKYGRRKILKATGALTTVGLAGCTGGGGQGEQTETTESGGQGEQTGTTESSATTTPNKSLEERAKEEGQVNLLIGFDKPDALETVFPKFYEDYPWAEGKVVITSSGTPVKQLAAQAKADNITFDYTSYNAVPMFQLLEQEDDLLMPINEDTAPEVTAMQEEMGYPASYTSDGVFGRRSIIKYGNPVAMLYNTEMSPVGEGDPRAGPMEDYTDITADEWARENKGISMEAPHYMGDGAIMFATLFNIWGEQKWNDTMESFSNNNPQLTESASKAFFNMANGMVGLNIGLINDYVTVKQRPEEEQPPVSIQWLDPPMTSVSRGGILKDAENPNFAKLFCRWFISERGQRAIGQTGRTPASAKVASEIDQFNGIIPSDLEFKQLAFNNEQVFQQPTEWKNKFEDLGL